MQRNQYRFFFGVVLPVLVVQVLFAALISRYEAEARFAVNALNYVAQGILALALTRVLMRHSRMLAAVFLGSVMAVLLLINGAKLGLLIFSGSGFTHEFFHHIEPTSFAIAWHEYAGQLVPGFGLALLFLGGVVSQVLRSDGASRSWRMDLGVLAVSALLLWRSLGSAPAYQLAQQWLEYRSFDGTDSVYNREDYEPFLRAGIMNSLDVRSTDQVEARIVGRPRNLILIYLESFNFGLTEHPQYPGLTPEINRLQADHPSSSRHFSSAYVTVEGIVASQCGTLLPMFSGNDSLVDQRNVMPNMACLGDVLRQAGYQQWYIGGADLEFAGKGEFLAAHGYDQRQGWEYWKEQGKPPGTGAWGLGDSALIAEAIRIVEQAGTPYHLSLLTLGTHLPGYSYGDCQPYSADADPFVNAVHCTDRLVGRLIRELGSRGLLEDTVVFITSDHGVFPTLKMRELFGDMVDDRRLLAVAVNADGLEDDWEMASYDTSPTLLDLLGVEHNQQFLFGRSALRGGDERPMVTRYQDWVGGKPGASFDGECGDAIATGAGWNGLNRCQKDRLLRLTQSKLDAFSAPAEDKLACLLPRVVTVDRDESGEYRIALSGHSAKRSFKDSGRLISKQLPGFYLVELGHDHGILERNYFGLAERDQRRLLNRLEKWTRGHPLLLIHLDDGEQRLLSGLTQGLEQMGITPATNSVHAVRHGSDGVQSAVYAIDSFPFALGQSVCETLFRQ